MNQNCIHSSEYDIEKKCLPINIKSLTRITRLVSQCLALRILSSVYFFHSKHGEVLPVEKVFKVPNVNKVIEEGKKAPTKFRNIKLHRISDSPLSAETFTASGLPSISGDALKALAGKVSAEYDFMEDISDISLKDIAEDDAAAATQLLDQTSEIQKSKTDVETDTSAYGSAFVGFGGGERGKEACHAIASLCEVCSIDSLISNFILPLQVIVIY